MAIICVYFLFVYLFGWLTAEDKHTLTHADEPPFVEEEEKEEE